jgi:hypothetical protein
MWRGNWETDCEMFCQHAICIDQSSNNLNSFDTNRAGKKKIILNIGREASLRNYDVDITSHLRGKIDSSQAMGRHSDELE